MSHCNGLSGAGGGGGDCAVAEVLPDATVRVPMRGRDLPNTPVLLLVSHFMLSHQLSAKKFKMIYISLN